MKKTQTMILPIEIPTGKFCADSSVTSHEGKFPEGNVCDYLTMNDRELFCKHCLGKLSYDKDRNVLKPEKCRYLHPLFCID